MEEKRELLRLLQAHEGEVVSGEELARHLGTGRTAVSTLVNSLKKDGHQITTMLRKGYRLSRQSDAVTTQGLALCLPAVDERLLVVKGTTGSTNTDAKLLAATGAAHGTVVTAEEQVQGRGRLGRNFHSPKGSGVYMSILLRPGGQIEDLAVVTIAAAVAVCRAVKALSGEQLDIKWVNDLFYHGRKVGGILTEATYSLENGGVEALVVGIGLNAKQPSEGYPAALQQVIGALPPTGKRVALISAVYQELMALSTQLATRSFLPEYKAHSLVLGKEIVFDLQGETMQGKVLDITEDGHLKVHTGRGEMLLRSGEVSLGSQRFLEY